jgi:hypothetical protein
VLLQGTQHDDVRVARRRVGKQNVQFEQGHAATVDHDVLAVRARLAQIAGRGHDVDYLGRARREGVARALPHHQRFRHRGAREREHEAGFLAAARLDGQRPVVFLQRTNNVAQAWIERELVLVIQPRVGQEVLAVVAHAAVNRAVAILQFDLDLDPGFVAALEHVGHHGVHDPVRGRHERGFHLEAVGVHADLELATGFAHEFGREVAERGLDRHHVALGRGHALFHGRHDVVHGLRVELDGPERPAQRFDGAGVGCATAVVSGDFASTRSHAAPTVATRPMRSTSTATSAVAIATASARSHSSRNTSTSVSKASTSCVETALRPPVSPSFSWHDASSSSFSMSSKINWARRSSHASLRWPITLSSVSTEPKRRVQSSKSTTSMVPASMRILTLQRSSVGSGTRLPAVQAKSSQSVSHCERTWRAKSARLSIRYVDSGACRF